MVNKKKASKKSNSKNNKKRKSKKLQSLLIIIVLVALIVVTGYLGYKYYNIAVVATPLIEEMEQEYTIPKEATADLELITEMPGYDNISVSWKSSNENVISSKGKLNRPSYLDGDRIVTLTATYSICDQDKIAQVVFGVLNVEEKEYTYKIFVKALEATDQEKVDMSIASLVVPNITATSFTLRTSMPMFDSVSIDWTSSDSAVLSNDGEIKGAGDAILTATVKSGEVEKEVTYDVSVISGDLNILYDSENFDGFPKGSDYDKGINTGEKGWTVVNGISQIWEDEEAIGEEKYVVLKSFKDSNGILSMNYDLEDVTKISFYYQINEGLTTIGNNVQVILSYSQDLGATWNELDTISITDLEEHFYEKEITIKGKIRFQIKATSDRNTHRVDIDDLEMYRSVNIDDVSSWIEKNIITVLTHDYALPLTTAYGGSITWESLDSSIMTKDGIITRYEETKKVTLKAKVSGFGSLIEKEVEITITGYASRVPVEIYFIDLGKYGQGDCGESIYIKCSTFDILIDAGDSFQTSSKAIEEVINNYSEDKVIDYIVATHPDSDHIGGMKQIFADYEILNLIQFDGEHTSAKYTNYKNAYLSEGLNSICTASESVDSNESVCSSVITITDDVTLTIINTSHYIEGLETNTRSVVTLLEAYGTRVLFTGDADNNQDKDLETDYMNLVGDIDILKAVHHATANGTTTEFLKVVDPETVIICNGNYFGNKHGHPTPDAINRIYQYDSSIEIYAIVGGDATSDNCSYETSYKCDITDPTVDRNGTILITITEAGYVVTSEYYSDEPLELSSTTYWKECSEKEASYGN